MALSLFTFHCSAKTPENEEFYLLKQPFVFIFLKDVSTSSESLSGEIQPIQLTVTHHPWTVTNHPVDNN